MLCSLAAMTSAHALALAKPFSAAPLASTSAGATYPPLLVTPLVVPGVQIIEGGQQLLAAEEARRYSPQAFVAREASPTASRHLDDVQARELARKAFPSLIDQAAGGPPKLRAGEPIVGFVSDNAAQLSLPGGERGVLESSEPIALQTSRHHHTEIDLRLLDSRHGFRPALRALAALESQTSMSRPGGLGGDVRRRQG